MREPGRQRWIDDDTVEFIHLLLGDGNNCRTIIWAEVTMTMNFSAIDICHVTDISKGSKDLAERIARWFRKKDWKAKIVPCKEQPDLNKTGTKVYDVGEFETS